MDYNNVNVQFGNILRKIRETRGMTQETFALYCGVSRAYYGRIERGEHSVTLDICQRIADSLGMPVSELFVDLP